MNEEPKKATLEEREKAQKEKAKKLKEQREREAFKRKYFDYYDDIKISYHEDW